MKRTFKPFLMALILGLVTLVQSSFLHEYYMSNTYVEYEQEEALFKITSQLFIDDVELAVFNLKGEKMLLHEKNQHPDAEDWLSEYLKNHLIFSVNGQEQSMTYLGTELEGEVLFVYMEIPHLSEINSLQVHNDILIEDFPDQRNIMDIDFKSWQKRVILYQEKVEENII